MFKRANPERMGEERAVGKFEQRMHPKRRDVVHGDGFVQTLTSLALASSSSAVTATLFLPPRSETGTALPLLLSTLGSKEIPSSMARRKRTLARPRAESTS